MVAFSRKFAPKSDTKAPKIKVNYIDQVPKGAVLFISQSTPHVNACYGGIMSLRAQQLGAAGTVIDGGVRDLQEQQDLKYPLLARTTVTTAGGAVCFPSEINVPVTLQSSVQTEDNIINRGDYNVAGLDGAVVLPADLAEKVLEIVPGSVAADEKCAEAIRGVRSVQEAFATFRGK